MSSKIYSTGIHNVGSYMAAGSPYLTQSAITTAEITFEFPRVTKRIVAKNTDSSVDLQLYFSASSGEKTDQYIVLPYGKQVDMDVKCTKIYAKTASGTANLLQIYAEITSIPTGSMYSLDGVEGV